MSEIWIFGYGSLMWDGWESEHGCIARVAATLEGYGRTFNKASTRNWGAPTLPCPTLNLEQAPGAKCVGIAFAFNQANQERILQRLRSREGPDFEFRELPILLKTQVLKTAITCIHAGNISLPTDSLDLTNMVHAASGRSGTCRQYILGIAQKLQELGIQDDRVSAFFAQTTDGDVSMQVQSTR